jgi:hypothetical protein
MAQGNGTDRNVRFGSKADMCSAIRHVRFTRDNDLESEFPHMVMSALPPKANMCGATTNVRYGGPLADTACVLLPPRFKRAAQGFQSRRLHDSNF